MRKIFTINNTSDATDIGLLIARIGIAILMFTHGIPKLLLLFSEAPIQFPSVMGMSAELSLCLAIFAEVICSVFILIGFATRLAALPLIVTMLIAAFFIHLADPFSVKESSLHYLLVYIVFLFTGSGKYSVDNLFQVRTIKLDYAITEKQKPVIE